MQNLEVIVKSLISSKKEGDYWDFKELPHDNNAALLHDILCLANSLHQGDRYLIFGVTDPANGCQIKGLTAGQKDRKTQVQFIDFLRSKPFAGHLRPETELHSVNVGNYEIDVLTIFDRPLKPYYLNAACKEQGKEVRANHIYSRVNDSNTPIDNSADLYFIEKMWRQRFGLDLSALERMRSLLRKPDEWFKDIGNKSYLYHREFPEFNIELSDVEDFKETFSFFFTNEKSFLGNAIFKYHSTPLFELEYMYCDEMRVVLPVPSNAYLRINDDDQWYYYYDLSTVDGDFLKFLTDLKINFKDGRGGCGPFLIFRDDDHKGEFDTYLLSNSSVIDAEPSDFWGNHAAKRIAESHATVGSIDPVFVGKVKQMYDQWLGKIL